MSVAAQVLREACSRLGWRPRGEAEAMELAEWVLAKCDAIDDLVLRARAVDLALRACASARQNDESACLRLLESARQCMPEAERSASPRTTER